MDGRFFHLDDHLTRVQQSCAKMRLRFPIPREEIKRLLVEMVARSGIRDAFVQIMVTRGLEGVRESVLTKREIEDLKNNLYMFITPYIWVMEPEMQLTGGDAVIARTVRRTPPGAFDPTVKNLQSWCHFSLPNHGDANITEGSGFNIVCFKDEVLHTADPGVLEGITRKSVIEIAHTNGHEVRLETVPVDLAYHSDEMFMCTTAGGVMPITYLDKKPVKDSKIGPITKKIWDRYWAMHYDDAYSFEIDYDNAEQKTPSEISVKEDSHGQENRSVMEVSKL
ncbi:hypothetical protein LTR37_008162 [Vermiconidia calcicola]|uniref:Uncharacterized protein n=1 Tax=Vermiconidia calcicola TaxID=1690605 RepID=A0ACC3NBH7_9PEZI|nr:hypothetical protein LTR37_008162 [Vermiconidia calcicola]